jgi:hypothetical protein
MPPNAARSEFQDFAEGGDQIELMSKQHQQHWQPHLDASKSFQRLCLEQRPCGGTVAVLGAGRLLDLDLDALVEHFEHISLYDADTSAQPTWQRAKKRFGQRRFEFHFVDLTTSMSLWTSSLKEFLRKPRSAQDLYCFLHDLEAQGLPCVEPHDTVLSLNILGQLGTYWVDRVHAQLARAPNTLSQIPPTQQNRNLISASIAHCRRTLELQHLALLQKCAKQQVILTTDTHNSVITYNVITGWITGRSEQLPLHVKPEELALSGFDITRQENWQWHRIPKHENNDVDVVTTVRGYEFVRPPNQESNRG